MALGSEIAEVLPSGFVVKVHWKISEDPSASFDALPSKVTTVPSGTVWSGPALAAGGWLPPGVVMVTVSGALLTIPSLTVNWATYWPATSATKLAIMVVAFERAALLPVGFTVKAH